MKKTLLNLTSLLLVTGFVTSATAASRSHNPDKIREAFAMSGDSKLQLAADALGDDQLIQMLEQLKKSSDSKENTGVQKALKKLQ